MTVEDELAGAKSRVSKAMLGRNGVHAVGTARPAREILLRVDPTGGGLPEPLLRQAQSLARPFAVRVVEEQSATFAAPD